MTLGDSRIWLTGASSGIGEALVAPLLDAGARVALTSRRRDVLDSIAGRFPAQSGRLLVAPADVTDRSSIRAAVQAIDSAWGGVDLAILNAGTHAPVSAIEFDIEPYIQVMTLNFFSVLYCIDAVLPQMLARGSGYIAGVASLAGYRPLPTAAAYGASKAALAYALQAMRFDLEPRGVDVTVINPGFVRTPLTDLNTFHMPALIDAADAARMIVRGLRRRRKEIHFPARFSWTLKAMRVLPYPIYEWIIKLGVSKARLGA